MLKKILEKLHKLYNPSKFLEDILGGICTELQKALDNLIELKKQFFFDELTIWLEKTEDLLGISSKSDQSIEDRRYAVRAKWLAFGRNNIELLQSVVNSWKNGICIIDFIQGKFNLTFTGVYGIPKDFDTLVDMVGKVKPAHIPIRYSFKYLLIKDIHEIKTNSQMQKIPINNFACGKE